MNLFCTEPRDAQSGSLLEFAIKAVTIITPLWQLGAIHLAALLFNLTHRFLSAIHHCCSTDDTMTGFLINIIHENCWAIRTMRVSGLGDGAEEKMEKRKKTPFQTLIEHSFDFRTANVQILLNSSFYFYMSICQFNTEVSQYVWLESIIIFVLFRSLP